jgi:hypothetical protein
MMEWLVEFEGRQTPMEAVWSDEFARIVSPLKHTIETALAKAADPDELNGLKVVIYAEEDDEGASWGFKFAGTPVAVNYAFFLMGERAPIVKPGH